MIDYAELYRQLAREIIKHEGVIAGDSQLFVDRLVKRLKADGYVITQAVNDELTAYLNAMREGVKQSIEGAASLAAQTMPEIAKSALVTALTTKAFNEQWPDGKTLSERLWRWEKLVRYSMEREVQNGIKAGKGVSSVMMEMQRTIERASGDQLFKIIEFNKKDWVKRLNLAAKDVINNPEARINWNKIIAESERHLLTLKRGSTRNAAEQAVKRIKQAVEKGSKELADDSLKWWLYNKQQYHLKRIVRTEMATAMHKAVIESVKDDQTIIGFQWKLSASHPVYDICNVYANVEMGLGKGVFTKETVPHHKAHPHCMCTITPRVTEVTQRGYIPHSLFLAKVNKTLT